MKKCKPYILLFVFCIIVSIGDSMNYIANVGVSPYEAVVLSFHSLTHFTIGTVSLFYNLTLIILQLLFIRKISFKILLQIPFVFVQSFIVDLFVIYIFSLIPMNYFGRILFMLGGITLSAIGVGLLMSLQLIVFPLEGFCQVLSNKLNFDFPKVRQEADLICVIISLALTFIFSLPFSIREGTIIAALIFGPIMGKAMKVLQPRLENYLKH